MTLRLGWQVWAAAAGSLVRGAPCHATSRPGVWRRANMHQKSAPPDYGAKEQVCLISKPNKKF